MNSSSSRSSSSSSNKKLQRGGEKPLTKFFLVPEEFWSNFISSKDKIPSNQTSPPQQPPTPPPPIVEEGGPAAAAAEETVLQTVEKGLPQEPTPPPPPPAAAAAASYPKRRERIQNLCRVIDNSESVHLNFSDKTLSIGNNSSSSSSDVGKISVLQFVKDLQVPNKKLDKNHTLILKLLFPHTDKSQLEDRKKLIRACLINKPALLTLQAVSDNDKPSTKNKNVSPAFRTTRTRKEQPTDK